MLNGPVQPYVDYYNDGRTPCTAPIGVRPPRYARRATGLDPLFNANRKLDEARPPTAAPACSARSLLCTFFRTRLNDLAHVKQRRLSRDANMLRG